MIASEAFGLIVYWMGRGGKSGQDSRPGACPVPIPQPNCPGLGIWKEEAVAGMFALWGYHKPHRIRAWPSTNFFR